MSLATRQDEDVKADGQRGYIMPMTALLLIPMMLFAGFATDVGSWFLRGQQAQIAADAGAVAGVVWIPDTAATSTNALEAVRRNGYPNATLVTSFAAAEVDPANPSLPWVTVTLTTNSTLEVSVRTIADTYFTSPVLDNVGITRSAEAQYIEPTPLGNPTSALGTGGDEEYPGMPDNFYLQTRRDTRRNGDIIGPAVGGPGGVVPTVPNPLFTNLAAQPQLQGAYFFEVDIPAAATGLYRLEVRVSCRNRSNWGQLGWSVYGPDATDGDITDNVSAGALNSGTRRRTDNTCTDADPTDAIDTSQAGQVDDPDTTAVVEDHIQFIDTAQWMPMQNLNLGGKYILRVRANTGGVLYSIRAVRIGVTGPGAHCTSIPLPNEGGGTDAATPNCPAISAIDWLGSAAIEDTLPSGTEPIEIFLTEVRPELEGNQLEVTLFDPADGIECVRVLDPFGNAVPFTWRTIDNEVWGYSQPEYNTFTNNGTGDLADTNSVPCGPSGGTALTDPRVNQIGGIGQVFQDRTVRFFLTVGSPACNGADCWYRVQYEKGAAVGAATLGDWNSWSVRVVGDPVRLIR